MGPRAPRARRAGAGGAAARALFSVVMVFLGVRVYAAAAMAGLVGMVWLIGWDAGAGITGTIPHSKSVNYVLSVLPMFILIGFIAYHAGLTHALFNAARAWFGWVPGQCWGLVRPTRAQWWQPGSKRPASGATAASGRRAATT